MKNSAAVQILALLLAACGGPAAGGFEFVKVVGTDTAIPGRSETFLILGVPSLDSGGSIVFCGGGFSGGSGLYTTAGGDLRVAADASVPIPGQATAFAHGFRSYGASIDGGSIAFYAFTQSTELGGGIYLWKDGSVSRVADGSTPIPGGTGTFNAIEDNFGFGPFSHPPIRGDAVAFRAASDSPRQRGIYTFRAGTLDVVADLNTAVPGGTGNFTFLSAEISIEGGKVAFRGEGQNLRRGIYTNLAGPLAKVADTTDPIPGGTGSFTSVEFPWLDDGRIIFAGRGSSGQQGIYLWDGGSLSVVVDLQTPIPGGAGAFTDFTFSQSQPSLSRGSVLFRGLGSGGQEGIYVARGGAVAKVIGRADILDGKTVETLLIGPQSLRGGAMALLAGFADRSSGIYLALPSFLRGDANADGEVDLSDAVATLFQLFLSAEARPSCEKSPDADDSGRIDLTDAIFLLDYLFGDGTAPCHPFPGCGADLTLDGLTCDASRPCE